MKLVVFAAFGRVGRLPIADTAVAGSFFALPNAFAIASAFLISAFWVFLLPPHSRCTTVRPRIV